VSNALYGLQELDSKHAEVCALVEAMNSQVAASLQQPGFFRFVPQGIGNAISGLQSVPDSEKSEASASI
jgi:hypothetical protein